MPARCKSVCASAGIIRCEQYTSFVLRGARGPARRERVRTDRRSAMPDRVRRSARLAGELLNERELIVVGIADVHLAVAPGLISRGHVNRHAVLDELGMKRLYIIDDERRAHAGRTVALK